MKRVVSGILLALILTGTPASASIRAFASSMDESIAQNSGFEYGLSSWYVSTGTAAYSAESMDPKNGTCCAKGVELNRGSLGRLYQDLTDIVQPGEKYKIGGWIKTQDVVGYVVIALNYVNNEGWTPADGYVKEIGYATGTTNWTYYESNVFTLPPMPSDASAIWFLFDFNDGEGSAWWDDVSLVNIYVPILGDLNLDRKVDIKDITTAALAFGSFPGHPRWNPVADVNHDYVIDIRDLVLVAGQLGETYP